MCGMLAMGTYVVLVTVIMLGPYLFIKPSLEGRGLKARKIPEANILTMSE